MVIALLRSLKGDPDQHRLAGVAPVFLVRAGLPAGAGKEVDAYDTTLRWIWKIVDAREAEPLDALRRRGEWHYNDSSGSGELRSSLAGLPIVVHLSGAPLIEVGLDQIEGLGRLEKGKDDVRPALLLDENTSLIQVALDLKGWDGRLPEDLAQDASWAQARESCGPRYWMFIGVQLSDPAVRLRLLSREISLGWTNTQERPHGPIEKAPISTADRGVVVNTWAPVSERQLFHWQGFGVVKSEAWHITGDIVGFVGAVASDYAEWLL